MHSVQAGKMRLFGNRKLLVGPFKPNLQAFGLDVVVKVATPVRPQRARIVNKRRRKCLCNSTTDQGITAPIDICGRSSPIINRTNKPTTLIVHTKQPNGRLLKLTLLLPTISRLL
jgi:hypothetical protein